MTDTDSTQASLGFMEASKRAQDEADMMTAHRERLVRRIMDASVNRPNLYRMVTDQLGAQAFTVEALELAARVVEVFDKRAEAQTTHQNDSRG